MRRVVLLGAVGFISLAHAVSFEFSVGAMSQDPSGYIQYPANTGTRADLEGTLGLGEETRFFARAKIEIPVVPNLYLQYIPMKFEGRGRYTQNLTFGNTVFQANVDLYTSVKLDHYDVGLYYNLPLPGGTVDPEIGLNVRIVDFRGTVTGREVTTNNTITESKSVTVPIPMVYGGLGVHWGMFSLIGEVRGIVYGGSRYYDITGEVRIRPFSKIFVGVGYRYENLRLDDVSDVDADIKIRGLFGVAGVTF
jgi:outer membrane protein